MTGNSKSRKRAQTPYALCSYFAYVLLALSPNNCMKGRTLNEEQMHQCEMAKAKIITLQVS